MIRDLNRVLVVLLAGSLFLSLFLARVQGDEDGKELRAYDVLTLSQMPKPHLLSAIGFFPFLWDNCQFSPEEGVFKGPEEDEEITFFIYPDELASTIRTFVDPASWEEEEGVFLESRDGWLMVNHTEEVLEEIEGLLGALKEWKESYFEIGVFLLSLKMEEIERVLGKSGGILNAGEVESLLREGTRAKVLQKAYTNVPENVRGVVNITHGFQYLADFDVEIAQAAVISDPVIRTMEEGLAVGVQPYFLTPGSDLFGLDIVVNLGKLLGKLNVVHPGFKDGGAIELPELGIFRQGGRTFVPQGGGVLMGCSGEEEGFFLLITVNFKGSRSFQWESRGRTLSFYPTQMICKSQGYSQLPPFSILPVDSEELTWEAAKFFPGGEVGDPEWIEDVLRNVFNHRRQEEEIDPFSWNQTCLWAFLKGEDHKRVQKFFQDFLEKQKPVVALKGEVIWGERDFLDNLFNGSQTNKTLEKAEYEKIAGNFKAKALNAFSTSLLNRTWGSVRIGKERALLYEADPEVAQEASIADPIIGEYFEGLALEIMPLCPKEKNEMVFRLEGYLNWSKQPFRGITPVTKEIGLLQLTDQRRVDVAGTFSLLPGRILCIPLCQHRGEGGLVMVLSAGKEE